MQRVIMYSGPKPRMKIIHESRKFWKMQSAFMYSVQAMDETKEFVLESLGKCKLQLCTVSLAQG